MRQDKKQKDRPAAALVLCFCLMAIVSVFVVKASIDKVHDKMQSEKAADVVKEKAVDESTEASQNIVDSIDTLENSGETDGSSFIVPVTGDIIMDYSMDMPVYHKTLDQYMTHSGIDIAAPSGTTVSACASGTVTRIDEDDRLGITVEINHGNGIISVYGNLAKNDLIELGEIVSKGDTIGRIGRTSLFEFEEDDHLHFEIRNGSEPDDPRNYIQGL
ncbi:MAG: M23 family metallopeptidase [Eubacteriales bacterium]|nr:M23 family metallopeptidase [Eubacteriales bacterium]